MPDFRTRLFRPVNPSDLGHRSTACSPRIGALDSLSGLAYLSVALLVTLLATALIWSLTASFLTTPAAETIAASMGVHSHAAPSLKPEPIERATFWFSTVVALLTLCAAGFLSVRRPLSALPAVVRTPMLFSIPVAGISLSIWVSRIEWLSLLFPQNVLYSTMASRPITSLSTALALTPAVLLCGWLSSTRLNWVAAVIFCVPLALLTNLLILRDGDPYLTTAHYEVFVYPLIQDWLGEGVYCMQESQYGMYPSFLLPIWMFTGGPSTFAISTTMALLMLLSNASFVIFMQRHTHISVTGLAFAFVAILFSVLCIPGFLPNHAYFQFFPIRLVFPALALLLICLRPQSLMTTAVAYMAAGFGVFWNLESGLVALSVLGTYCLAMEPATSTYGLLRAAVKQAALMCSGVAAAAICVNIYCLLRFQQLLNPLLLTQMVRAFTAGFGALPMPLHGVWIIHLLVYAACFFLSFRLINQPQARRDRERAAAMLATAVMGLMFFNYYQGRSAPHQLALVTFPAIMCLGLLVDQALSRQGRYGVILSCTLSALLVAPTTATLLIWLMSKPFPHRGIYAPADLGNDPVRLRTDLVARVFREHQQDTEDTCVVVTPYTYFFQLTLGKASPVHATGITQVLFDNEMAEIRDALLSERTRMAVFDDTWIHNFPTIRETLEEHYLPYEENLGCSTCKVPNMRIHLRTTNIANVEVPNQQVLPLEITGPASQSTTFLSATASKAVDGYVDGNYYAGSTTHTGLERNPWWQVDTGENQRIDSVRIWNRVDSHSERLKGFWVFISDTPFDSTVTLEDLSTSPCVSKVYCADIPCPSATMRFPFGTRGRYVRVQLQGTGYLCIAEVQVTGARPPSP